MCSEQFVHEDSYKKGLASFCHRNRLRTIQKVFYKYVSSAYESWADFGCSNGFIIQKILERSSYKFKTIVGFDHSEELIKLAREKNIPNAEFKYLDLNNVSLVDSGFDVATCFETLEHVGDYKNAFTNIYNSLKQSGILIITVPNETGIVGLIKFLGRLIIRRNAYDDFFENKSCTGYIKHLLTNRFIDGFRSPSPGYAPHLGFDYRMLKKHIDDSFLKSRKLELIDDFFSGFRMNIIMVFRKLK